MNLYTNIAIRTAARFDYEGAYDRARTEISDALLAGQSIKCGSITADLSDAAEHAFTRLDADQKFAELVTGLITPEQFKAWALCQLHSYADRMATDRAQDMLECSIDAAEYAMGDR